MRDHKIEEIVCRDLGRDEYLKYSLSAHPSPQKLSEAASRTLESIPSSFGSCVMMSAALVAALDVYYSIPAIAVVGDLRINGFDIFKCKENIPMPTQEENLIDIKWDGHCWVEVSGIICDLSIFRSAYSVNTPSLLKSFVLSNFGEGRGALLSPFNHIPQGMVFNPKYVLNEVQINGILAGLNVLDEDNI